MFLDLAKRNRSYRRYDNSVKLDKELLTELVLAARYAPSACNFQRLRYVLVTEGDIADKIFDTLRFANYLKDWKGPSVEERPSAYIVIMTRGKLDELSAIDLGIAAENILLAANDKELGGCIFRGFARDKVTEILAREGYEAQLVISVGKPIETVRVVDAVGDEIKYYRDENMTHYVPKRTLDDLII